jgi:hypothetical protein
MRHNRPIDIHTPENYEFTSMLIRIRIQGAKRMRIHADPGQTLPLQISWILTRKVYFM